MNKEQEKKSKVLINDFIHLVVKKLGLDLEQATFIVESYLDKTKGTKYISKYMDQNDVAVLRQQFLSMVDVSKMNDLDYKCFLKNTNDLLENGSKRFHARGENNKHKKNPVILTMPGYHIK